MLEYIDTITYREASIAIVISCIWVLYTLYKTTNLHTTIHWLNEALNDNRRVGRKKDAVMEH